MRSIGRRRGGRGAADADSASRRSTACGDRLPRPDVTSLQRPARHVDSRAEGRDARAGGVAVGSCSGCGGSRGGWTRRSCNVSAEIVRRRSPRALRSCAADSAGERARAQVRRKRGRPRCSRTRTSGRYAAARSTARSRHSAPSRAGPQIAPNQNACPRRSPRPPSCLADARSTVAAHRRRSRSAISSTRSPTT